MVAWEEWQEWRKSAVWTTAGAVEKRGGRRMEGGGCEVKRKSIHGRGCTTDGEDERAGGERGWCVCVLSAHVRCERGEWCCGADGHGAVCVSLSPTLV